MRYSVVFLIDGKHGRVVWNGEGEAEAEFQANEARWKHPGYEFVVVPGKPPATPDSPSGAVA